MHPFEYNATVPRVFSFENNKLPIGNRDGRKSVLEQRKSWSRSPGLNKNRPCLGETRQLV